MYSYTGAGNLRADGGIGCGGGEGSAGLIGVSFPVGTIIARIDGSNTNRHCNQNKIYRYISFCSTALEIYGITFSHLEYQIAYQLTYTRVNE